MLPQGRMDHSQEMLMVIYFTWWVEARQTPKEENTGEKTTALVQRLNVQICVGLDVEKWWEEGERQRRPRASPGG